MVGEVETQRHTSLFDWPVAFTKVKLMAANCTLAKCSEEHVNHKKYQSQVYRDLLQYVDEERERERERQRERETETETETEREV